MAAKAHQGRDFSALSPLLTATESCASAEITVEVGARLEFNRLIRPRHFVMFAGIVIFGGTLYDEYHSIEEATAIPVRAHRVLTVRMSGNEGSTAFPVNARYVRMNKSGKTQENLKRASKQISEKQAN